MMAAPSSFMFVVFALFIALLSPAHSAIDAASVTVTTPRQPHAVFVSVPLPGHVNPLLIQGAELARRGWKVSIATSSLLEGHINHFIKNHVSNKNVSGSDGGVMSYMTVGDCNDLTSFEQVVQVATFSHSWHEGIHLMATMKEMYPCFFDGLSDALHGVHVDVVIADVATQVGVDIADKFNIPYVINNADLLYLVPDPVLPTFDAVPGIMADESLYASPTALTRRAVYPILRHFLNWLLSGMTDEVNYQRMLGGLPPTDRLGKFRSNLILVNGIFGVEYARPIPPLIQMVGPMLIDEDLSAEDEAWLSSSDLPVVFVSFGTLAPLTPRQINALAMGLRSSHYRVLWKLKKSYHDLLPLGGISALPPTVRVTPWVSSQVGVLKHPRTRAFVSHCGINSVYESLDRAKPVLCIPMFADQLDMAWRVKDASCGRHLDKHTFTGEEVSESLYDLITDPSGNYSAGLQRIQSLIGMSGGPQRAADLIEYFAKYGPRELATADSYYPWYALVGLDVLGVWAVILLIPTASCIGCCRICRCLFRPTKSSKHDFEKKKSESESSSQHNTNTNTSNHNTGHRPMSIGGGKNVLTATGSVTQRRNPN